MSREPQFKSVAPRCSHPDAFEILVLGNVSDEWNQYFWDGDPGWVMAYICCMFWCPGVWFYWAVQVEDNWFKRRPLHTSSTNLIRLIPPYILISFAAKTNKQKPSSSQMLYIWIMGGIFLNTKAYPMHIPHQLSQTLLRVGLQHQYHLITQMIPNMYPTSYTTVLNPSFVCGVDTTTDA